MEAICTGDGSDSTWRRRGSTFPTILTEFSGGFSPHFHNFTTTIGPQSGHDRASIVVLGLRRSLSDHVEAIPREKACDRGLIAPRSRLDRAAIAARSRLDRGLIAPRSRLDREVLPQHLCTVRFLSILIKLQQPSDGDLSPFDLMPIGRSSGCHVARGKSFDPRHLSLLF